MYVLKESLISKPRATLIFCIFRYNSALCVEVFSLTWSHDNWHIVKWVEVSLQRLPGWDWVVAAAAFVISIIITLQQPYVFEKLISVKISAEELPIVVDLITGHTFSNCKSSIYEGLERWSFASMALARDIHASFTVKIYLMDLTLIVSESCWHIVMTFVAQILKEIGAGKGKFSRSSLP